jgi:glycosyltransferase 2 family protein
VILKSKRWIAWLIAGIAIVAFVIFIRNRIHFNWQVFVEQLKAADWKRIAFAISLIYCAYVLRAARWALFVRPTKKVSTFAVLGSQVIGFTAVALFGRLADLVRPYLVARRINLSLGSQIAVYTVERMFDLGSMALIFSTVLLFSHNSATLPHHELLVKVARLGLLGTLALAAFAITVRISGNVVANLTQKLLRPISAGLADAVADKIRAFRNGLNTISSLSDFGMVVAISLTMWGLITYAYLLTAHAFIQSPQLAGITLSQCMLLMAASMGGSAVQLPVIGWFTSIGVTTTAMQKLFDVAWEPALGCGAILLVVTFMSIIPVGLLWAHFDHVSLKKVTEESEHAGDEAELGVAAAE